jgi:hypothetical protein
MLGVMGIVNEEKSGRKSKKGRTVWMREVVVGDGLMLGVVGTINEE